MSHIDGFLETLGYDNPKLNVTNRKTIRDLIPNSRRCGIYVLHFANDEYYVGQAANVISRFKDHQKTYHDIQFLSFKSIIKSKLDDEEVRIIHAVEANGFNIRNKQYASATVASSPFDEIFTSDLQERWHKEPRFNIYSAKRNEAEGWRIKYRINFDHLMKHSFSDQVMEFLREYVKFCLPNPIATEWNYWNISCFPYRTKPNLLIRVSITQEVLTILEHDNQLYFVIYMTKSNLNHRVTIFKNKIFSQYFNNLLAFRLLYNGIKLNNTYNAGGVDQVGIEIQGVENALRLLKSDRYLRAMRIFNLRLMRKGNLQSRAHNYDLADKIFEGLHD